ncbi:phage baseplate assembly protein V [Vibrio sp. ER1A]|uniref:phage baseplate assembly protein V n=1 Tax=Vibrio sp. ER1A TaxID=1517681 RepID=UPI00068B430B|nr:phage baseplate assembly protein V [Vibrio sp. ER1A]
MEFTQAQLHRLLSEMIQFGTITEVQASPLRYKVKFGENRISDWLRSDVGHAAQVKDWHPHQVGEQVIVIRPFNSQGGTIIASLNQAAFDQPQTDLNVFYRQFPDGTQLKYDMKNHVLSGKVVGKVNLDADTEIFLKAPKLKLIGDIEHTGDQHSTGSIKSDSDIADSTRSMADDRDIYNDHDHNHGDPIVGKPNQEQ